MTFLGIEMPPRLLSVPARELGEHRFVVCGIVTRNMAYLNCEV